MATTRTRPSKATRPKPAAKSEPKQGPKRIAVLAVHGIGEQKKGSTLRQVGDPLLAVMRDFVKARGGACIIRDDLKPADGAPQSVTANVEIFGAKFDVAVYESRWSEAFRVSGFSDLGGWMPIAGWRVAWAMFGTGSRGLKQRQRWIAGNEAVMFGTDGEPAERSGFWTFVGLVSRSVGSFLRLAYAPVLVALLAVGLSLGLGFGLLLVVALLLGSLWKATKDQTEKVRNALVGSIGDAFTFERTLIDRAAMVEQVADDLALIRDTNPDAIFVVAHSLGAAVCFEALSDPVARAGVTQFVTLGNALGVVKVATRHPGKQTVVAPLDMPWQDFFTSFDPVPVGELTFDPQETGTSSHRVGNRQSLFTDHTTYFENTEQVMGWIAGSIFSAAGAETSDEESLLHRVERATTVRRYRKSIQSNLNMLFTAGLVGAALLVPKERIKEFGAWSYMHGKALLKQIPDPIDHWLPKELVNPTWKLVVGGAVLAVIGAALFELVVPWAWRNWDAQARRQFVAAKELVTRDTAVVWARAALVSPAAGAVVWFVRRNVWDESFGLWANVGMVVVAVVAGWVFAVMGAARYTLFRSQAEAPQRGLLIPGAKSKAARERAKSSA